VALFVSGPNQSSSLHVNNNDRLGGTFRRHLRTDDTVSIGNSEDNYGAKGK
jgi:hypothetical protein